MAPVKLSSKLWRLLTDFWTLAAFVVSIADFLHHGELENIVGPVMAIYIVVLAIFSAEKEFERWYSYNLGRHRGEVYVYAWTALIIGIFIAVYVTGSTYRMSPEIFSTYLVVLGILAVTQKSKQVWSAKQGKE